MAEAPTPLIEGKLIEIHFITNIYPIVGSTLVQAIILIYIRPTNHFRIKQILQDA